MLNVWFRVVSRKTTRLMSPFKFTNRVIWDPRTRLDLDDGYGVDSLVRCVILFKGNYMSAALHQF